MKTKFSIILALFTFYFANAQQDQVDAEMNTAKGITFSHGDMFIEGALQIATGGDRDYYAFNPKFGYFLNDKFAVGGQISFSSDKYESTNTKTNIFGIGGFARYYVLELDKKRFKAYGEVALGYGRNKIEDNTGSDDSNSLTANINVGLNYFVTKNIAVTFVLANLLSYNSVSPENGPSSNTFELNVNLFNNIFDQPKFGLLYRF